MTIKSSTRSKFVKGWARGGRTNSLDSSIIAREISSGTSHDRIFNAATFLPNNLTSRSTFNHEVFPLSPPFFHLSAIISLFQTSNDGAEWGKIAKKGGREHSSCLKEVQSDWRTNYREVYQSRTLLPFLPLPPPLTLSLSLSLLEPTLPHLRCTRLFYILIPPQRRADNLGKGCFKLAPLTRYAARWVSYRNNFRVSFPILLLLLLLFHSSLPFSFFFQTAVFTTSRPPAPSSIR